MPTVLFVLFALLCAAGAYLAARHARASAAAAAGAAVAVLVLFGALFWWIAGLLREGGVFPGGP